MQIALEGIDGAGKSYALEKAVHWLEKKGVPFKVIKDAPLVEGRLPKKEFEVLDKHFDIIVPDVRFFLYLAKSVAHYKREVLWEKEFPLSRVLLWDRSLLTPLVYTYYENYVFSKDFYVKVMKEFYDLFPKPDVTFVFLPPVEVCYKRVMKRRSMKKYYLERDREWLQETRNAYIRAIDDTMIVLEGEDCVPEVLHYLESWYETNYHVTQQRKQS